MDRVVSLAGRIVITLRYQQAVMTWVLALLSLGGCGHAPQTPAKTPKAPPAPAQCPSTGVALQVLGSGGPIPDDGRASSGYLVWVEGRARALIDAGGGVFLRFAESGALLEDLDVIALSHLHADHSADLVALLKGAYFIRRKRELILVGPSDNERFPAIDEFLKALIEPNRGSHRYLSPYLEGTEAGWFRVRPVVVPRDAKEPQSIELPNSELKLAAVGVKHGQIPALGFRVEARGKSVGFSGDQSAQTANRFVALVRGVDLLVMHHAIGERDQRLRFLHVTPSEIGQIASGAKAKRLVLSHHMQRALKDVDGHRALIAESYEGPVDFARDLGCYPLSSP